MAYSVVFTGAGEKSFGKLDRLIAVRMKPKILALADDTRPHGCTKLAGYQDLYRVRAGDYRIVYRIDDASAIVEIAVVAHRRDVYRDL
jgi:mRNA interferase RelE/StbE